MYIHELPVELQERILDYIEPWELRRGVAGTCKLWAAAARRRAPAVRRPRELRALRAGLRALLVPAGLDSFQLPAVLAGAVRLAPRGLVALTLHAGLRLSQHHYDTLQQLPHLRHLDVFSELQVFGYPTPSFLPRLHSVVFNDATCPPRKSDLRRCRFRAMHMYGYSRMFKSVLVALRASRAHLTELTLRCMEMSDRTFQAVGECDNLETLQLYSCWLMRGAGAAAAARGARLRRLHVTGAVLVRRADLAAALTSLPLGLEELVLSGDCFTDEHVAIVAACVPQLAVLEAWDCPLSAAGALRLAAALPRLRVLDLNRSFSARQVAAFTRHPTLEFLRYLPENSNEPEADKEREKSTETKDRCTSGPGGDSSLSNETSESEVKMHPNQPIGGGISSKDEDEAMAALNGPPRTRAVRVEAATAPFADDYFRGAGAGFRGRLLYSWTPALQLRPRGAPPTDGDFDF